MSERARSLNILLVDDDPDWLELAAFALERAGFCVVAADNVDDALMAFDTVEPDVLVSDLSMPGRDGFDLIRALREHDGSRRFLPAIAVSAAMGPAGGERALSEGFDVFMAKPLTSADLIHALTRLPMPRMLAPTA